MRVKKRYYNIIDLRGNRAMTGIPSHLNNKQVLEYLEDHYRVLSIDYKIKLVNVVVLKDTKEPRQKLYNTTCKLTKMKKYLKTHNKYKYHNDDRYKSLLG